ncbi:transcriptional repressor, partial [Chloroflexota bacterium]
QREAILNIVKNTNSHPNAEWVYEHLRSVMPHISLGTVYRNLRLLKDEGLLQELRFNGSQSRFDGKTSNHAHFICDKCEQISDVEDQMGAEIKYDTVSGNGMEVTHRTVAYFGICSDCSNGTYKSIGLERRAIAN